MKSSSRLTRGPDGKASAFEITKNINVEFSSDMWPKVASSFPDEFALHLEVFLEFDQNGILLSINHNQAEEFTVVVIPSNEFRQQIMAIKLPGLRVEQLPIMEVNEGWYQFIIHYSKRDGSRKLSLFSHCDLISEVNLAQDPGVPYNSSQSSRVLLPQGLRVSAPSS